MAPVNPPVSQARSFGTVFLIEMWERFGYYGMQALMVYFMVERLRFDDDKANLTWGAFSALVYAAPAIGGWLGDKVLGTRRTMTIGAVILAAGYLLLSIPSDSVFFLYCALGVVVVGNGLFKSNSGNLVRKIYDGDDAKIDSAFTIYYMAVNVGSTVSILLTPWIRDKWGWNWAFAVCCGGLVLGLFNYSLMYRTLAHVGSPADNEPVDKRRLGAVLGVGALTMFAVAYILQHKAVAQGCVYVAGIALLGIFAYLISISKRSERSGLVAALVLNVQSLLFFVFYQQMSTSLALFALRNVSVDFSIFGVHLFDWIPAQFQALNPIWIMILSPVLAWSYTYFGKRGKDLPIAGKFALGFAVVAIGFFIYGIGGRFAVDGRISSWFMVWGYGFYSLGELLVSGLGLAMIARYVPDRMGGFMMGGYFVVTGISQYLGSVVANFASVPQDMTDPVASLPLYTDLFNKLGFVAVGGTLLAILLLPMMKRLSASHNEHALQAKTPAGAEAAAE